MLISLSPLADEPELNDPDHAGEWAGALAGAARCDPPRYFYFVRDGQQPVGVGLFKSPPAGGAVEIAYLVFLGARGRGVATAIAAHLVTIAREHSLSRVVAHTMREINFSTRVLAANGFNGPCEVVDPENGPVWRWELALFRTTPINHPLQTLPFLLSDIHLHACQCRTAVTGTSVSAKQARVCYRFLTVDRG